MNYENYTDEELIDMIRDGDSASINYLMEKYKPLVKSRAGTMYMLGGEEEDLIQEGMIGLFKALNDYDCGRDASFYTFAVLCVSRQLYSAVKASNRQKNMPLNSYVSFFTAVYGDTDEDGEGKLLLDKISVNEDANPESMVIADEKVRRIWQIIDTSLSSLERSVIELAIIGWDGSEIAAVLGKDKKSIENSLARARAKIKKEYFSQS